MAPNPYDAPDHARTPEEEAAAIAGEGIDSTRDALRNDRAELDAIGAEIDSIKASISNIGEATAHYVKRRVAANSTDLMARNPLRTALWAAFAGFLVGRLSR